MATEEIWAASEALHCGILDHLKSRSSLPTIIAFKHTNFNFLFKHRGHKSNDSGAILLESDEFKRCHFPNEWHMIIDCIGDGVKIYFPVKVRLFLGWSVKTHTLTEGSIVPQSCFRPEKLSISFSRAACSLSQVLKITWKNRIELILYYWINLLKSVSDVFLWYKCGLSVKGNIYIFLQLTDILHAVLEQ